MLKDLITWILNPDIAFALALILVAAGVFFAVRIGLLPKKSAPFVAVALLAAVGFSLYRQKHARNLQDVLKAKEKKLKANEAHLNGLKKQFELSEKEATEAVAKRDAEVQAITEEIVVLKDMEQQELEEFRKKSKQERLEHVLNLQFK